MHGTLGGAWREDGRAAALGELTDVVGAEAVDILFVGDSRGDGVLGEVSRQRQLDKDAVDGGVVVEAADQVEDFGLGSGLGEGNELAVNVGL